MTAAPDRALLEEAAGWLVRFQSEALSASDHAAFERWRGRSAAHAAASVSYTHLTLPTNREV